MAPGFARNFLVPRQLAEPATPAKVAELKPRDDQRARHEARTEEQAREVADMLAKTELRFDVKAGPTGALFGSVTPTDIADEIWRTRKVRVDRRKISLDEPIKRIGRYSVPITVFGDVSAEVKTMVVPEGGELPPEEELEAMAAAEAAAAAPVEADASPAGDVAPDPAAELEPPAPAVDIAPDPAAELEPPAPAVDVPDDAFDRAADASTTDTETEEA